MVIRSDKVFLEASDVIEDTIALVEDREAPETVVSDLALLLGLADSL